MQLANTTDVQRVVLQHKLPQLPHAALLQLRSDPNLQDFPVQQHVSSNQLSSHFLCPAHVLRIVLQELRAAILRLCPYTRKELLEPMLPKIHVRSNNNRMC